MPVRKLRLAEGPAQGSELSVEDELVIGREQQDLGNLAGDHELSRRHARFWFSAEGALLVEDLGSTNGTFVNGERIRGPHVVRPGDRISLGATVLESLPEVSGEETSVRTRVAPRGPIPPPPVAERAPAATPRPAGLAGDAPTASRSAEPREAEGKRGPAATSGRFGGGVAAVLVVALIIAAAVGYLIGHAHRRSAAAGSTPSASSANGANAAAAGVQGTVYIESNIAQPSGNSILAFRYRTQGNLHPMEVTEYPTGGAGSADLTDSGVLDADQHLWLDTQKHLLFAVNQGSDTIAVFHVFTDGSLRAVAGSPFSSGGLAPASVGVSGTTLIVTNKAQDGVRDLKSVSPTYATFHIGADGTLTPFGPVVKAPAGNSPTDAMVAPSGTFVMSTEEGGPFRAFVLGADGLRLGGNSPVQPDASIFPAGLDPSKRWGLGISANPNQNLVYIGMATVNKIAVYRFDGSGRLTFVRAVKAPGAELPCWTLVNRAGTRLYTANAGNNTMSVFDLSSAEDPRPLQTLRLHGDGNPWDIRFDPTQQMIFLIDPRARMNVAPGKGQGLHTLLINTDGTLAEPAYSPVAVPVGFNVNPFGMAVYGHS